MQINVNANQIKTEFGAEESGKKPFSYSWELSSNPIGYIIRNIEKSDFFPTDIKMSAINFEEAHQNSLVAKKVLIASKNNKGAKTLQYLFSGKNPVNRSEIYQKFLILEAKEIKAFNDFKEKYLAWYNEYKTKPENNPWLIHRLVDWKAANRQDIPKDISIGLENLYYKDAAHDWQLKPSIPDHSADAGIH